MKIFKLKQNQKTKNKQKTGLHYKDLIQALIYGIIIKNSNLIIKRVDVIFNGYYEDWYINVKNNWINSYGIEINLVPIRKWLEDFTRKTGIRIDSIYTCQKPLEEYGFESKRSSKKAKWYLNVKSSNSQGEVDYANLGLGIGMNEFEIDSYLKNKGYKKDTP